MVGDPSKLNIIFHHPRAITSSGASGSQVRPYQMLDAFRRLGVKVTEMTGNAHERAAAAKVIRQRIESGEQFDFVYSENLSIPFAMSESHRLPTHPLLDHNFLSFCNLNSIPVGLFYRDVFWRDTSYKYKLPLLGRFITIPLYYYDWIRIIRYTKVLFIPSYGMKPHLPGIRNSSLKITTLPPASRQHRLSPKNQSENSIRIVYIGGIEPPIYDLSPLLKIIRDSRSAKLTICCRDTEWKKYKHLYSHLITDQTSVVHKSGTELISLYQEADIQAIVREPTPYLDFAVPVKLFESVGYGVPLLSTPNSEAARIIENDELGWVKQINQIPDFLQSLATNPELVEEAKKKVKAKQALHSWEARAEHVCEEMLYTRDQALRGSSDTNSSR